ncbi:C4-dicarboxylate ABC transporter permease [Natronolimnobius baerhuensis]|uniref:C4-dicarboxylate ABC transporter permease n=1 Tax=Natronolimnobius baerhuensis TaxID=253108 RepID=A0A202E7A3_9EURY|nr:C4-dicarboxylate ABC transporter permease [Natronolimnobius baerhuensis]
MHSSEELSEEEQKEILQEVERTRSPRGPAAVIVALLGITFSAFQMWIAARSYVFWVPISDVSLWPLQASLESTTISLQQLQVNALHVTFALVLAFLLFPASRGTGFVARRLGAVEPAVERRFGATHPITRATARVRAGVRWAAIDPSLSRITPIDIGCLFLALLPVYYTMTEFDEIREIPIFGIHAARPIQEVYPWTEPVVMALATVGIPLDETSYAFLMGVLGLLLVLEATRRTLGPFLMALVASFIVYAHWGYLIPRDSVIGALSIQPESWGNIVYNLWYTVEAGVMSTPVTVSVRFIYIFILFGAFLEMSGAGKWFIDLAYSLTGTRKGGPAKASTVSSGFMGMLSGSSIANTVTTGAFTIPLMKRSGYSPEFSGAVESSSSSGGQMLPPVMGAAAFLIMEFTGTPYADVIIAATLPAIAFFFGMWVMVHFEAVRGGIGGLPRSELPDMRSSIREGWFYLIPIVLLLYFLVIARFSVNRAGWFTIVAVIALIAVVTAYDRQTRIPLFATIAGLTLAQAGAFATTGGGLVHAIQVAAGLEAAGTPYPLEDAAFAAASDLGTIAILVSLAFILARPRAASPLLELDDEVDDTAEHTASKLGRPTLAGNSAYRFGTFVLTSMDSGARTATTVVVAVAAAGVVPGVISVSGLGPNLAALIGAVSGDSMLLLLVLMGISSIIFGMGMPTTAMYIILIAMLGGPIEDAGIVILAGHLFVLYFGLMADVTPPVAVAAFAGAGVAKADEMQTAIIAFMLSLNKVLVPFAFVFSPGILLIRVSGDDWWIIGWADVAELGFFVPEVVIPVAGMFLGVYALGATIIGYQYAKVTSLERILYTLSSIFLMVPEIPLLITEAILGLFGIPSMLTIFSVTAGLRAVGLVMLVGLTQRNRERALETDAEFTTPATSEG